MKAYKAPHVPTGKGMPRKQLIAVAFSKARGQAKPHKQSSKSTAYHEAMLRELNRK